MKHLAKVALIGGTFFLTTSARADLLPSPPRNCPAGSVGKSGKEGTWCEPTTCTTEVSCPARSDYDYSLSQREQQVTYACEAASLCIHEEELILRDKVWPPQAGKGIEFKEVGRRMQRVASKVCSSDKDCGAKEKCESAPRCLEATRRFKDDGGVVYFFKPQAKNVPAQVVPQGTTTPTANPTTVPSTTPSAVPTSVASNEAETRPTVSGDRCACDLVGAPMLGSSVSLFGAGAFLVAFLRRRRK